MTGFYMKWTLGWNGLDSTLCRTFSWIQRKLIVKSSGEISDISLQNSSLNCILFTNKLLSKSLSRTGLEQPILGTYMFQADDRLICCGLSNSLIKTLARLHLTSFNTFIAEHDKHETNTSDTFAFINIL